MSYGQDSIARGLASPFRGTSEENLDSSTQYPPFVWRPNSLSDDSETLSEVQAVSPLPESARAVAVIPKADGLVGGAIIDEDKSSEEVVVSDKEVSFDALRYRAAIVLRTLYILVLDTADACLSWISWIKWPTIICLVWIAVNISISTKTLGYTGLQPLYIMCQLPTALAWTIWPCNIHRSFKPSADFPRLSEAEGDALQTLLEESAGFAEVGWDLSKSELAMGDLIRYIHTSNVVSKRPLLDALRELQQQIRASVNALRTLRSSIIGSVQRTMATNEYTLHALRRLSPSWKSLLFPALEVGHTVIVRQYFDYSIEALVNGTAQVLTHCKVSIDGLESMSGTLSVIHEIISREHGVLLAEHDELQSSLWTLLGGNRERLQGLGQQLVLLGGITNHRAKAMRHTQRTMEGVLNIQRDVWHIRSNVAVVDVPTRQITPKYMEQQLYDITTAMARVAERLDDTRKRTRQLERDMKAEWDAGAGPLYG